ncbi:hypothetical protein FN846DRAFT_772164 [Sphaerosporella brunnea]|uniref:Myb-like domain-containing protein n=1 Tax=Sphaerosporella brunnea TaxID=1250544 RepID=A0A5J5F8B3_9PEZI|nr:hypothetical protein FN846DRAFT_772164 [Sphaerosporella brunnea]
MAHHRPPPHLGGGSSHLYGHTSAKPRARTHEELELDPLGYREDDDQEVESHYHHLPPPAQHNAGHHHARAQEHPQHPQQQQQLHHHHMGDHPPPAKMQRTATGMSIGGRGSPGIGMAGPSTAVVQVAGGASQQMPSPAPRPRGPKLKFTPEDDTLLVDLKENKSLTWKQIAEFFPGRSSGTLQVRYCTKLKAKTTQWTDETVQRLRTAMTEYEQDRWRLIAAKVGSGFSPAACREKAREITEGVAPGESEGSPQ